MTVAYKNIARVVSPHGNTGEVVVQPVRGLPFLLEPGLTVALTPPALKRDRFCVVEAVRDTGTAWHVRFSGLTSIGDAEGVTGCYVLARVTDLDIGPLDAAYDDIVGREVVDAQYGSVGCVTEIMETPANDVWVITGGPYGEVLMPVIDEVIDHIPASGPIAVALLPGLVSGDPSCA